MNTKELFRNVMRQKYGEELVVVVKGVRVAFVPITNKFASKRLIVGYRWVGEINKTDFFSADTPFKTIEEAKADFLSFILDKMFIPVVG